MIGVDRVLTRPTIGALRRGLDANRDASFTGTTPRHPTPSPVPAELASPAVVSSHPLLAPYPLPSRVPPSHLGRKSQRNKEGGVVGVCGPSLVVGPPLRLLPRPPGLCACVSPAVRRSCRGRAGRPLLSGAPERSLPPLRSVVPLLLPPLLSDFASHRPGGPPRLRAPSCFRTGTVRGPPERQWTRMRSRRRDRRTRINRCGRRAGSTGCARNATCTRWPAHPITSVLLRSQTVRTPTRDRNRTERYRTGGPIARGVPGTPRAGPPPARGGPRTARVRPCGPRRPFSASRGSERPPGAPTPRQAPQPTSRSCQAGGRAPGKPPPRNRVDPLTTPPHIVGFPS